MNGLLALRGDKSLSRASCPQPHPERSRRASFDNQTRRSVRDTQFASPTGLEFANLVSESVKYIDSNERIGFVNGFSDG